MANSMLISVCFGGTDGEAVEDEPDEGAGSWLPWNRGSLRLWSIFKWQGTGQAFRMMAFPMPQKGMMTELHL
jgi:hypothetical protein